MSDVWVFTSQEAADLIRAVLQPLAEQYGVQARRIGGGNPDTLAERAHWIGQAQGVTDAIEALLPAFGVRSPGGREPCPPVLLREQVGSPQAVDRVVANRGRLFGGRPSRWAS